MAFNLRKAMTALFKGNEQTLEIKGDGVGRAFDLSNSQFLTEIGLLALGDYTNNVNFVVASEQVFQRNVIAYRCIQMVAGGVAGLHWVLKNKNTKEVIDTHPLLDLLATPNPLQGRGAFFHNVQADKMLDGNYFIHMVKPVIQIAGAPIQASNKPPTELWTLRPDMVTVVTGTQRLPLQYDYMGGQMGGMSKTFNVNQTDGSCDIIHGMAYNPLRESERGRGQSQVAAAFLSTQTHNEAQRWNRALLKNGARPSIILTGKDSATAWSQEQVEQLREMVRDAYSGSANAGKPFLAGNVDVTEVGITPKDMDFVNGKDSAARDIALGLGVPPTLLHLPGDTAYSNVTEARIALYQETILPEGYALRDELNRRLVPLYGPDLMLDIDLDCIEALAPIRKDKSQYIMASPVHTINEKRAAMGLEPLVNGDVLLIPTNVMPLDETIDDTELPDEDEEEGDNDATEE